MALSTDTLKALMRDYHGFHLTDEEFERVRLELDLYLAEVEKLCELDLSTIMSARLLRADEGGHS